MAYVTTHVNATCIAAAPRVFRAPREREVAPVPRPHVRISARARPPAARAPRPLTRRPAADQAAVRQFLGSVPSIPLSFRLVICGGRTREGPDAPRISEQSHRAPSMILTQVHLRKPCYDFYFLEVTKFVSLSAQRRDARERRVPRAVREPH